MLWLYQNITLIKLCQRPLKLFTFFYLLIVPSFAPLSVMYDTRSDKIKKTKTKTTSNIFKRRLSMSKREVNSWANDTVWDSWWFLKNVNKMWENLFKHTDFSLFISLWPFNVFFWFFLQTSMAFSRVSVIFLDLLFLKGTTAAQRILKQMLLKQ